MLEKSFQTLMEASEELCWDAEMESLRQMQFAYEQKLYFVAFIGRFSAGKSYLLNNLLERDILPQGVLETTPLLTYIRYGEQERARLHYLNGDTQVLTLEQVANLEQHSKDWNLEELDYLEVFLKNALLAGGMVLLDTPGAGTLIQRHEQLLSSSLALAARIVYVSGGAPSRLDVDQLDTMRRQGFDMLYVRTHCDEIQEREESGSQVIAADLDVLEAHGINKASCYHLSNLPESSWFSAIEPLRQALASLGAGTEGALERDMEAQLSALAQRCCPALEDKLSLLRETVQGNAQALEKRHQAMERNMQALQEEMNCRCDRLKQKVTECRRIIEGRIRWELKSELEKSVRRIEDSGMKVASEEEMGRFLREEAGKMTETAYQLVNGVLDPVVQEINGELCLDGMSVDQMGIPLVESYTQMRQTQDIVGEQLREKLIALRSNREELERILVENENSPRYGQLVQNLQELEGALVELQEQNRELGPYMPHLIEVDQGVQPSQVARMIGDAADWALLLLPGGAIAKGVTWLGETKVVMDKLPKLVGVVDKAGQIIKKGDSVKDVAYALSHMSKTYKTKKRVETAAELVNKAATQAEKIHNVRRDIQNRETSFLDYLTIGYWAETVAKNFDAPPKMVVDQEREQAYMQVKRELEDRERRIRREQYERKCELKVFKTEQERQAAKRESIQLDEQKIQAELAQRSLEIEEKARRQGMKKWKRLCAEQYQEQMLRQLEDTLQRYLARMPECLSDYQDERLERIAEKLQQEQAAYESAVSAPDEAAGELERVSALLERVRSCVI